MSDRDHKPQARRPDPAGSLGLLGWLGLGAVGLASVLWWQRDRRRRAARPPADPPAPPEPAPASSPPDPPPDPPEPEPPAADESVSWIPGPAGSIRVFDRHPDAELALVFVHGLGGRLDQWSAQLAAAGPGIRAVAFDLPGHGESDPHAASRLTVPDLAGSLGAVVDGLGIRRAVLVAHSLGCLVALDYADRNPERVTGLLLVDPSGDQTCLPREERERFLAPLRRNPRAEAEWYFRQILAGSRPGVGEQVLRSLEETPSGTILAYLEAAAAYSPLPALERWEKPMLAIVSDLNCLPYSLHELRTDLRTAAIHGAGHWLMMDEPEAVLEILWDFLEVVVERQARAARR